MFCFCILVDVGSGLKWKLCFETFSWKIMKSTRNIDIIIMSHVDVSSCGILLRRVLCSQSLA